MNAQTHELVYQALAKAFAEIKEQPDGTKDVTELLRDIVADAGFTLEIHKNRLWVY
jgi:hypothetical protein